ncbi:MAG: hypothetical protein KGO81_12290 [Bacteroidota bacterium]|nr:hypothetical protein [Bacteroidota bacterium]
MLYIFKTSVKTKPAIQKLAPELNKLTCIIKWNFDLHDRDHILRIEATDMNTNRICELLNNLGFSCIELH